MLFFFDEQIRQMTGKEGVAPVLGQFQDDLSVCGEDDEGHSQHGAAKHTVGFKLVKTSRQNIPP